MTFKYICGCEFNVAAAGRALAGAVHGHFYSTSDSSAIYHRALEGKIREIGAEHNHEASVELFNKKQVRAKIREDFENGCGSVNEAVEYYFKEANGEEIGNIDAFKQAVRRINRKTKKEPQL